MTPSLRLLPIALALCASAGLAADWPHLRGPAFDGRIDAPGTFEPERFGLALAWRVPLGSSYSGVAVADGRAVTMYADAEADWIAAFDAATGERAWRVRLGEVTRGHDGSHDGPLSSPVATAGRVWALTPVGRLLSLRLADGNVVWERRLDRDFGSKVPDFGFTTTPLVEDDVLVVQVGGSGGRSIVGLDRGTGETRWSHGEDEVSYQSPTAMTLAGRRQLVAAGSTRLTGLAPDSGKVLWEREREEDERGGSTTPTFIGDDRFLVLAGGGAIAYRVSRAAGGFALERLYKSDVLGQTYAQPVYHDGHVYGFRGQVLACMDAATGERVWRSRPPGGDGLILVDGHLVIFAAHGDVVVAEATPEGYRERARLQALEGSALTWPSFADGRVYVRNFEELAAVKITAGATALATAESPGTNTEFARWVGQVEAAADRKARIDAYLASHGPPPLIEGEYVHFLYRGPGDEVAIEGSMLDNETPQPMRRVAGTDLFYRTFRLEPGSRWEYRFQVDFEDWLADPGNARSVPVIDGEGLYSELVTPGYRGVSHVDEPGGPRGSLDSFTLSSQVLGYDKEIRVWLPPGYAADGAPYPLLVVNDGQAWLDKGLMANALDNLVGARVRPVVVAFVPACEQWWTEAGGARMDDYVRMLAGELLPALHGRYHLAEDPASRAVMGNMYYGLSSAYAALKHPEAFGGVAVQSVYLGLGHGDELAELIRAHAGSSVRFYLDWNRYDVRNVDRNWDFARDSRSLAGLLRAGGYTLLGGEELDSAGWGGWRNRTDRVLTALFPIER